MDVLLTCFEPVFSETWFVSLDKFFSSIAFLQEVCDSLLEDTDPLRVRVVEDDILIEVVREADRVSLEELSFENS